MWVISLCAWRPYYRAKLKLVALPSINAALAHATGPIQFILHTDEPDDFKNVHFAGDVILREFHGNVVGDTIYNSYGEADRIALEMAPEGANIAFLASDIMVSKEFFHASEKRFAEGKRCIIGSAARTMAPLDNCPAGLSARELLDWSFSRERQHPATAGCYYGQGKNWVSWMTYFEGQHGTVGRAFHLHPFAVKNDRVLYFNGVTVDLDIIDRFTKDEIHVVVSPDEMAFAEISGLEKTVLQADPVSINTIVRWARNHTSPLQRWLFTKRIVVQGTGEDHLDEEPANEILRILG